MTTWAFYSDEIDVFFQLGSMCRGDSRCHVNHIQQVSNADSDN